MKKLLLFDIDGTLLTSAGGGHDKFIKAVSRFHKQQIHYDKDVRGSTDYLILSDILMAVGWTKESIKAIMPEILKAYDEEHEVAFKNLNYSLIPGVEKLLERLSSENVELGLLTGNLKSVAKRKLTSLGIWQYFVVGGFGSDRHETRADLVKIAVKRAGYDFAPEKVYIIGDTRKDIIAAKAAGVNSVGVSNGFRPESEFIDEGADIVLKDFTDIDFVIKSLGI